MPTFASVVHRARRPGVDLRLAAAAGWLEYDLLFAPGADLPGIAACRKSIEGLELE